LDDLDEIIAEFLVESHENLDQLDSDLVALEQDPTSRPLLGGIFRTIHTIRGPPASSSSVASRRSPMPGRAC
jgi:two-component system chemotaxis sensor kinase CheA